MATPYINRGGEVMIKRYILRLKRAAEFIVGGGKIKEDPSTFVNPSGKFTGKKVLVTGGSTGIGFEIAREYFREGAEVVITARRKDRLEAAKERLGNNPKLHLLVWDMAVVESCSQKLDEALKQLGHIDIFVNNAGIYKYDEWDTCSEKTYDEVIDINAKGLFFLCQAEANYLLQSGRTAKIINICSRNSIDAGFDPYTISKWEAASITTELAKKLFPKGIMVNGIAPGNVATNIHGDRVYDVSANAFMPSHLTERYVHVEEIASIVLFLSDERIQNITGQIIPVDGGWTLH